MISRDTRVEGLAGTIVVVVSANRDAVDVRLTGTGSRTDTTTTDLICSLDLFTLPSGFL